MNHFSLADSRFQDLSQWLKPRIVDKAKPPLWFCLGGNKALQGRSRLWVGPGQSDGARPSARAQVPHQAPRHLMGTLRRVFSFNSKWKAKYADGDGQHRRQRKGYGALAGTVWWSGHGGEIADEKMLSETEDGTPKRSNFDQQSDF